VGGVGGVGGGCKPIAKFTSAPQACVCVCGVYFYYYDRALSCRKFILGEGIGRPCG